MWELFQKLLTDRLTPNQLILLYAFDKSLSIPQINAHLELRTLIKEKYIIQTGDVYELTSSAKKVMLKYDNYFVKAKKKTSKNLLGDNYTVKVQNYRTLFPARKLPSGKPARQNEKTLIDCFRWFFENYKYTWEQVYAATIKYLDEYEDNDYMYMKTSQYFIVKTTQTKEKVSELADYCDMINEGTDDDNKHFKENVV